MQTILVVEDEPLLLMVATELLEDAGWSVIGFGTADEAIAFLSTYEELAAVITDINMPGNLDGLDLAAFVVRTRPDTPMIVTSGRYQRPPADLAEWVTFLPKPWRTAQLLAAVTANGSGTER